MDQVYFVWAEQRFSARYMKIGVSSDPEARLRQIQTGCPLHCMLYLSLYPKNDTDAYETEKFIHKILRDQRVRGEWFYLKDPVLNFIKNYHQNIGDINYEITSTEFLVNVGILHGKEEL